MRRCFDGLMAIIPDTYQMNPYENLKCLSETRQLRKTHGQIHCILKMRNILLQRLKAEDGRCILLMMLL